MRIKVLSILAGVGGALIGAGPAPAGFTGIKVVSKPNAFGLLVCNVFASFNQPGRDRFHFVAGTPSSPMDIHVIGGTFYQHPFGTDTPPSAPLLVNPSLAFDTFVTIGVKAVGIPGGQFPDNLLLTPGWPGFGPSSLSGTQLAWAVTANDPQSNPFNPDYVNGNGQLLIGQFSTGNGRGIAGMFRINVISNNATTQLSVSFFHVPGPGALALLAVCGLAGSRRRRYDGWSRSYVEPRVANPTWHNVPYAPVRPGATLTRVLHVQLLWALHDPSATDESDPPEPTAHRPSRLVPAWSLARPSHDEARATLYHLPLPTRKPEARNPDQPGPSLAPIGRRESRRVP